MNRLLDCLLAFVWIVVFAAACNSCSPTFASEPLDECELWDCGEQ